MIAWKKITIYKSNIRFKTTFLKFLTILDFRNLKIFSNAFYQLLLMSNHIKIDYFTLIRKMTLVKII